MKKLGGILGVLMVGGIVWAVIRFKNKNRSIKPIAPNVHETSPDQEETQETQEKQHTRGEARQEEYRLKEEDLKKS